MLRKGTDWHLESLQLLLKGARQPEGGAPGHAVGRTLQGRGTPWVVGGAPVVCAALMEDSPAQGTGSGPAREAALA